MGIQEAYIYCSRRNVSIKYHQEVKSIYASPEEPFTISRHPLSFGEKVATLQMNHIGNVTSPRHGDFYQDTGVVTDGYRRFEYERQLGASIVRYVIQVDEAAYQLLNTRRKEMLEKGVTP